MAKEKYYGKVTTGFGSSEQKEIQVAEFVQAKYNDNRVVTISKLEDETFFLTVENPKESGREPKSMIRLSKDSLIGLLTTCGMYCSSVGWDLKADLQNQMKGESVGYTHSENITIKIK